MSSAQIRQSRPESGLGFYEKILEENKLFPFRSNAENLYGVTDREGYHESRRCFRDTYPESCITKYTSIRRLKKRWHGGREHLVEVSESTLLS